MSSRKQVFKPFLENPYTKNSWPLISAETSAQFIDVLLPLLQPIGTYNGLCKKKVSPLPDKPLISSSVRIGFNAVNQAVEQQTQNKPGFDPVLVVFVCRSDIPNSMLTGHFPLLCAASSKASGKPVKLVQLSRGSRAKLSEALNADASYIAITASLASAMAAYYHTLVGVLNTVPPVSIQWLDENPVFERSNIKRLKTSAPIMKRKHKGAAQVIKKKEKPFEKKQLSKD